MELEHVDMFPDEAAVQLAFLSFVAGLRPGGVLLVCADDPGCRQLLSSLPCLPAGQTL